MPTTAMAVMEAMVATDTARGPLMPMPTTAMAVMEAMVATDTERGPLTPMPTTAMAVMEAMATDTARGLLMPTTAMAVMEAMAMADTAMASDQAKTIQLSELSFPLHHTHRSQAKPL